MAPPGSRQAAPRKWEEELGACRWVGGRKHDDGGLADTARSALSDFELASPELLSERALQKRVDTKFLMPSRDLPKLLRRLRESFAVVLSEGAEVAHYETLYFDGPRQELFTAHMRGRRPRAKVRIRRYVERGLCFLEMKVKDKYGVTTKGRIARDYDAFTLSDEDRRAVAEHLHTEFHLGPALRIDFPRVTLVGLHSAERVTIDLGVHYGAEDFGLSIEDVMIVELKQARFSGRSPGMQALRACKARRGRMSKYCVGTATVGEEPIPARLRPTIRELMRYRHV